MRLDIRKSTEGSIADQITLATGQRPIETTIMTKGVALVFNDHRPFAMVYRWLKFGAGKDVARIVDVDFDPETKFRFITIDALN